MKKTLTFEELMAGFAEDREAMRGIRESQRKTDEQIRKTHTEIEKISKLFGGHERNTGAVTEEYFADALTKKMTFAGMTFDTIARNVNLCRGKLQDEFDIVMYNGSSIALIEAKYKAHENDLAKLVTSKVQNFRTLFPHYANYKIYLGLASMAFYDDLISKAKELGVGILKRHGKTIEFSAENIRAY
ncbi:MAG: hypothetical protein Ta2A_25780 [Treponemataceae bacterium]|nr:MAG: hypothetical protein Ta2A_25780 [Treponemataceae bacterium]